MMESCPDYDIPSEVDQSFVQSSYRLVTEYLKQRVSYVWEMSKDERALDSWTLGTWSKRVSQSQIEKLGTAADKAKLPPATARNKPHQKKRSFKQSQTTFVVHGDARTDGRIKVNKVARRTNNVVAAVIIEAGRFEDAFGDVSG
jgi:hypothetical protein